MAVSYAELEDRLESNPQGLVGETYTSIAVPIHDNQSALYKGDWIIIIDSDTRIIKEVFTRWNVPPIQSRSSCHRDVARVVAIG